MEEAVVNAVDFAKNIGAVLDSLPCEVSCGVVWMWAKRGAREKLRIELPPAGCNLIEERGRGEQKCVLVRSRVSTAWGGQLAEVNWMVGGSRSGFNCRRVLLQSVGCQLTR